MRRATVLVAVAVAAAGLLLVSTHRWGLGVNYDSVVYVQASHSLSSVPLPQARDPGGNALYWWAPAYPVVLKAFGASYTGARFLNTLLLFGGVLLVGGIAWRWMGPAGAVAAAALYAFSPAVYSVHAEVLAEPLFIVLTTAALGLIAAQRSVPAGLAAGAAILTRYAGLPLVLVGALVFRGRDRLRFAAVSLTIYAAWLVRNRLAAGQATGRHLRWHPPSWDAFFRGPRTLMHLLVTPGDVPSSHLQLVSSGALAEAVAAVVLLSCLRSLRGRRPPRIVFVALLFTGLYFAFLVVTATFFDALTPLDERLLVPVVPSVAISLAWLMRPHPAAAVVVVCLFLLSTGERARTFSHYGADYSGKVWSQARISRESLPSGQLYSSWPAAIAYFTGRSPRRLPNQFEQHDRSRNRQFGAQVGALATAVRTGTASVVLLDEGFLQIPGNGSPSSQFPTVARWCHPISNVVFVCTRRR